MYFPKISILIPTYNRAQYLTMAVESALMQDYPNYEIVVSDNASTDDTVHVIKKFSSDGKFRYYRNPVNIGMAGNWKKLVSEYAKGEWFILISDDDYFIDKNYLSKSMKLASKYKDIVILCSNYAVIEEQKGGKKCYSYNYKLNEQLDGKECFLNYYSYKFPGVPLTTAICKRELAVRLNIFSNDILCPDTEAFLKIMLHGNIGFMPDVTACYRIHGSNTFASVDSAKLQNIFQNKLAYLSTYEYALGQNIFSEKVLKRWKYRVLGIYFSGIITSLIMQRKLTALLNLIKLIYADDKSLLLYVLMHFLNPKFALKLILSINPSLYKFSKSLWWKFRYKVSFAKEPFRFINNKN